MSITMEPVDTAAPPVVAPPAKASWWRRLLRPYTQQQTAKENLHLLLDLPVGVAVFAVLVTLISTGFGSLVTLIGIPVLLLAVVLVRVIANWERARARGLLDLTDLHAAPSLLQFERGADGGWQEGVRSWFRYLVANLKQATYWKELLYEALIMPWGIATFTVVVTVWSVAIGLVTTPLWGWSLPTSDWTGAWWQTAVWTVLGLVALVLAPWIIRGVANLTRMATRGLLGHSAAEYEAQIEHLSESRARSVDSATAERQRIERALHDGAQMRLTSLAMELGRAKEKMASDPEGAATLIDEAHADAKLALVELRDLARGIHPSVLTDRGLDAAVHALAARAPVPVDVTVDAPEAPDPRGRGHRVLRGRREPHQREPPRRGEPGHRQHPPGRRRPRGRGAGRRARRRGHRRARRPRPHRPARPERSCGRRRRRAARHQSPRRPDGDPRDGAVPVAVARVSPGTSVGRDGRPEGVGTEDLRAPSPRRTRRPRRW